MLTSNSSMSYRNRGNLRYYINKTSVSNNIGDIDNNDISYNDYDSVYPDIKRPCKKRLHTHIKTYSGVDPMAKSIKTKQYGDMWLCFDRNNFQTVWSSVDRANFKKAIIIACEVMRSKEGSVSILGIRKMLKDSNIQIISYEVLSVIVKKWLVNNPNPKKSVTRRNTVRHNDDSGQVCPCGDGILRMPDWWIKQALTPSW
jgi:hypothetical protein